MAENRLHDYSTQEIENREHDQTYRTKNVAIFGWTGTTMAQLKVNADGELVVNVEAPATGYNGGPVTVGTTAVELTFTGSTKSVMIQSDPDNTGKIWVGGSNITNAGANAMAQLEPGDAISVDLDDTSAALYAISDTASQNVFKLALT